MTMAKRSPTCRQIAGNAPDKQRMLELYKLSEHLEHESMAAICRRGGSLYTIPLPSRTHKERYWGEGVKERLRLLVRPEYSEAITPLEDDPCTRTGGNWAGTVHSHALGDDRFSDADVSVEHPDRKQCLLTKSKGDIQLKCIDLTARSYDAPKPPKGTPSRDIFNPEIYDPEFWDSFMRPCKVKVGKATARRPFWKTY